MYTYVNTQIYIYIYMYIYTYMYYTYAYICTQMNESYGCHTYEWVSHTHTHIWMVHAAHIKECGIMRSHGWTSHVWMSHAAHIKESRNVTHMNESCRTYKRVWHYAFTWVTLLYVQREPFICVTLSEKSDIEWRFCMCDVTHPYVWHCLFMCVTGLVHICGITCAYGCMSHIRMSHVAHTKESHDVTHMNESCRTYKRVWHTTRSHGWLFCMCNVNHSYVWHDVTLLYVRRDSFICVALRVYVCDVTRS